MFLVTYIAVVVFWLIAVVILPIAGKQYSMDPIVAGNGGSSTINGIGTYASFNNLQDITFHRETKDIYIAFIIHL